MSKQIGSQKANPETLEILRERTLLHPGTRWAAYENHDLGHRDLGHLQFLAIGPDCTFQDAPGRLPDTQTQIHWRYVFIGWLNLETGEIEPESEGGNAAPATA